MTIAIDVTDTILETNRLLLRAWRETDLKDFFDYASVEGVGEMAGWKHHDSMDESRIILRSFIADKNILALQHKNDKKVIGSMGIHKSWLTEEEGFKELKAKELGFVLSKDYWGRGLMPEAVLHVISHCFEEYKLDALTVGHFADNFQSKRVIEKCGFKYFKTENYFAKQLKITIKSMKYILTREDWLR